MTSITRTVAERESQAWRELKAMGLTFRKIGDEYRVNYKGGSEATAYYTDDIYDAVLTGRAMFQEAR